MLAGYYDDSADDSTHLVAGLVSQVSRWAILADQWRGALEEDPVIRYYKAHEARAKSGEFRKFTDDMVLNKERLLAGIILEHVEYTVSSRIQSKDFDSIILARYPRQPAGLRGSEKWAARYIANEYYFCFHGVVRATVDRLRRRGIYDQVDFFFDDQGKVGKRAKAMYESLKKEPDLAEVVPYLGACMSHDDKGVVALQAADLFASCVRLEDRSTQVFGALTSKPYRAEAPWPPERLQAFIAARDLNASQRD